MTTIWVWDISIVVQEMDAEYGMPGRASASSEAPTGAGQERAKCIPY